MAIKKLPSTGDTPRATGVPESLVPGGAVDSAGFPWAGRTFDYHGTAFAEDSGETPPRLSAAVRALRGAAAVGDAAALAEAHSEAILSLSAARLLVPLLAEAGELGVTPEGRTVEKTQELSIVTVAAPDGRRVMPVFSSVATMQAWNPEARPIPVPGPQAALAAAQEQTDLIIVDPGTPACELGVRRTQLEAMAMGQRVVPGWADAAVWQAFRSAVADDPRVQGIDLRPGDPEARLLAPETDVVLQLAPGLDRDAVTEIVGSLQQRWAASEIIAERIDSLRIVLR